MGQSLLIIVTKNFKDLGPFKLSDHFFAEFLKIQMPTKFTTVNFAGSAKSTKEYPCKLIRSLQINNLRAKTGKLKILKTAVLET